MKKVQPRGIKWSAPVLVKKQGAELVVTVPPQVCEALDVGARDVLNFTQLPDGSIQVWRVKTSSYASLDAMDANKGAAKPAGAAGKAASKPAKKAARKPAKSRGGKKK